VQLQVLKFLENSKASNDARSFTKLSLPGRASPRISRIGGFTLLELLVVIVIIGLLAGLVAPRYFDQVSKTNTKIARAQIDSLEKALDQYRLDVGSYPTTDPGLAALNTRPQNLEKWAGPYLKKAVPPDPWGANYIYKAPGDHGEYDLSSLGSDGQTGGSGEASDVTSWTP
jgi:general secretion pathway protein G